MLGWSYTHARARRSLGGIRGAAPAVGLSLSQQPVLEIFGPFATQIALDNNVDLLVCLTKTGRVARYLVRQKPEQIVLACSELSHVVRQVNCSRGVLGYKIPVYLRK